MNFIDDTKDNIKRYFAGDQGEMAEVILSTCYNIMLHGLITVDEYNDIRNYYMTFMSMSCTGGEK